MAKLQLSLAFGSNPRTRPVLDGSVPVDGIDLTCKVVAGSELFWRQLRFQEFDVSEMSMSSLLILTAAGDSPWVALPIFTSRQFFHTGILVRTDAGIETPQDLKGKRVAVPEYQQTAALWGRGVLQHEFGVAPSDMEWFMERTDERSHGWATGFQPPPGVRINQIPEEKNIGGMMAGGEVDATLLYITSQNLVDRSRIDLRSHPQVKGLFSDPAAEGVRYYRKTGLFPINHGVIVRRAIVEKHPWVALNLFRAFSLAKEQAMTRTRQLTNVYSELGLLSGEARSALAEDPYPYGVKGNRTVLETITRYSHDQGLTPRVLGLEELFAAPTMDL